MSDRLPNADRSSGQLVAANGGRSLVAYCDLLDLERHEAALLVRLASAVPKAGY